MKIKAIIASLLIFSCLCATVEGAKVVYFIQGNWGNFFDPGCLKSLRQGGYNIAPQLMLHAKAKSAGYDLRIIDRDALELKDLEDFEYIIVFDVYGHQLNYLKHYPPEKLILFLWEPPSVQPDNYDLKNHEIFSKVFTWNDDLVDGKKYFKLHWPVLIPQMSEIIDFKSKKFAALIASYRTSWHPDELYSKRSLVAAYYEMNHADDLDLFGRAWPPSYKVYRGILEDKCECLSRYKFNFAYENVRGVAGYVTEKIFDTFCAGCVPVYWGASNICDYIPKECFIDRRDFASEEELYLFLKSMTEERYLLYLQDIQRFLSSDRAKAFSFEHYVETVMGIFLTRVD